MPCCTWNCCLCSFFFYNVKVFLVLSGSYAVCKILMSNVGLFCLISAICWVNNMGIFLHLLKPGIHAKAVVISSWKRYQVFEI